MATLARCMKCKAQREMKDEQETMVNAKGGGKRRAMKGVCPVCGTKMFKFLKAK